MSIVTAIERGSEEAIKRMYDEVSEIATPLGLRFPSGLQIVVLPYSQMTKGFREGYVSSRKGNVIYLPERELSTRELYLVFAHVGGHMFQDSSNRHLRTDGLSEEEVEVLSKRTLCLREGWATEVEGRLALPLGVLNWEETMYQDLKDNVAFGDKAFLPYVNGREAFMSIGQKSGWDSEIEASLESPDDKSLFERAGQLIKQ